MLVDITVVRAVDAASTGTVTVMEVREAGTVVWAGSLA